MGQKNILYLFFIAATLIFSCDNEKKVNQKLSLENREIAEMKSFDDIEDAQVFLDQYLQDSNTFERELKNLLNSSPAGNSGQALKINTDLSEVLVSVKYQLETSKALIKYYDNNPIDCIEQLTDMQVSCSIGNACGESLGVIEVFSDLQLNDETLELLSVEILLHGSVKWFDQILLIEDIENGVYENIKFLCENSKITLVL